MLVELNRKIDRAKHATGSFLHDQVEQTQALAVSFAVAIALYAAAAVFLIAAMLVGATAGFRWIEINYGLFEAFGALGAILGSFMVLFIALAIYRLKRPAKRIVPLASRLRVAISSSPSRDEIAPAATVASLPTRSSEARGGSAVSALVIAASLFGWALVRRNSRRSA
ncbi:phage holin family protein [Tardiphaga sp.]|jgi:hypothetical protein|uniref:phage holin family protein n=1 Tax=Tardiphaga sp. TaxID=1926292 RepID=UPI0037D99C77